MNHPACDGPLIFFIFRVRDFYFFCPSAIFGCCSIIWMDGACARHGLIEVLTTFEKEVMTTFYFYFFPTG